ncbi:MAG: PD-(D/E)XK nuclease family protein, partial [Eudoraea sp.]|nr:PD-(D/E)XK nuclease family protein [Eudoraea sp.]
VLDHGYDYRAICILTRKRKHGILISDYLLQRNMPLVSSETLLLKRNKKVNFLLALLQHCVHPLDLENNYHILYYLEEDIKRRHDFIHTNLSKLPELLKKDYNFDFEVLRQAAVYDGLEYAVKEFQLAEDSDAYITFLLDEVLRVEMQEDSGISTFLNYWEKKKDKLSIVAPDNLNAIRIMTVHKSKGLEFPVVIFPFANSYIYEEINPKLWLPFQGDISSNFKEFLVSKKQEVQHYGPKAEAIYQKEQHKLELDAFNLLYVALTRAIDGLYVLTEKDLSKNGEHKPQYYSGLFIHYLKEIGAWSDENATYTFGLAASGKTMEKSWNSELGIPYIYSYKNRPEFSILAKAGILWAGDRQEAISRGTLIHQLMEAVATSEDAEKALESIQNVLLFKEEKEYYSAMVCAITNHPRLKAFFKAGLVIKNECEILTENGLILRPDRLVFNGNNVAVLDYKTGKKHPRYQEQLYAYGDALENMGYQVEHKVIVYIDKEVTPEFI